jgi:mono/diheme cytochrome c family protein
MTRTDCGLPPFETSKHSPTSIDRLSKWLVAGLVILIVTSEFKLDGARAETGSPRAVPISDGARATAASLFGDRCAVCHGPNGDGNGPGAANLNPRPVDFRNRKWQRSVTDEKIAKAIVYGGPAVGLSQEMAANPDLEAQPGVVAALVEQIRSLGSRPKK